jgi:hypothetical protein
MSKSDVLAYFIGFYVLHHSERQFLLGGAAMITGATLQAPYRHPAYLCLS